MPICSDGVCLLSFSESEYEGSAACACSDVASVDVLCEFSPSPFSIDEWGCDMS